MKTSKVTKADKEVIAYVKSVMAVWFEKPTSIDCQHQVIKNLTFEALKKHDELGVVGEVAYEEIKSKVILLVHSCIVLQSKLFEMLRSLQTLTAKRKAEEREYQEAKKREGKPGGNQGTEKTCSD